MQVMSQFYLYILILDASRFFLENNFDPMANGDKRQFEIVKKCELDLKTIWIKKTVRQNIRTFEVVEYPNAYIQCLPGYVQYLHTKGPTEGCGIGKMLMRLCLNEENIHNVANNGENRAMKDIRTSVEACKKDESCKGTDNEKQLIKMEKWAGAECSKMVTLFMMTDEKDDAHVYFKSALESGFSQMFIMLSPVKMYPTVGHCSVKTLQSQYVDGDIVNGESKEYVWGRDWFFCFPKTPMTQSKCTSY